MKDEKGCCGSKGRTMKDVSEVSKVAGGVRIRITDETVKKEDVQEIVDNCKHGRCECMSDVAKAKVQAMDVKDEGGKISIDMIGDLSAEDVHQALARSKKKV